MSIWMLLLYAVAMASLVFDGPGPQIATQIVATLSLGGFIALVLRGGIRKPVV